MTILLSMTRRTTLFSSVLLCCLVLFLAACDGKKKQKDVDDEEESTELTTDRTDSYKKLRESAEYANSVCPLSLGVVGEMTSVSFDDGVLVFSYDIDDAYCNVKILSEDREAMKNNMKTMLSNPQGDTRKLIQQVIDADCKLKVTMHGMTTDAVASTTLNADELEELMDNEVTPEEKLKTAIASTQAQLPMTPAQGMSITELNWEGDDVIYVYELDANTYSVDNFKRNATQVKETLINELKRMGEVERQFVRYVADANANLVYRYKVGRNYIDFKITNSELKELM